MMTSTSFVVFCCVISLHNLKLVWCVIFLHNRNLVYVSHPKHAKPKSLGPNEHYQE